MRELRGESGIQLLCEMFYLDNRGDFLLILIHCSERSSFAVKGRVTTPRWNCSDSGGGCGGGGASGGGGGGGDGGGV